MSATAHLKTWRRRIVKLAFSRFIWRCERLIDKFSEIEDQPVFVAADFPWTHILEENADVIRNECLAILEYDNDLPSFHELSPDQKSISDDDRWKTFFLFGMGYKGEGNCQRCPQTAKILERIPGMTTAFFSILAPGKRIPPHRGVFKGFLRCHLALVVPEQRDNCYMRVADSKLHWENGKCIVFDDTYDHEVHNDTGETRVVLLLDVLRPMRYGGRLLTRVLMSIGRRTAFVKDARRNYATWEERFEEVLKTRLDKTERQLAA